VGLNPARGATSYTKDLTMKEQRYYCFPDIHGRSDLLKDALSFVYHNNPEGGKIIFLGDYIDRGPDNLGVLQIVMNPPEGWDFVTLMGNHEGMFIDSYLRQTPFYDINAAKDIAGLSRDDFILQGDLRRSIDRSIIEWMQNLKLCHIEDKNVFAHAFYDDDWAPDQQRPHNAVWLRMHDSEPFRNERQGLYLTHGHTPRMNGPIKAPNRTNLDCGAVFYGRFVIAEYHKDIQGPVTFHEFAANK
jgi:serine/threonine protein phosphatase 1